MIREGLPINYARVALAAAGGFVAYFILGGLLFAVLPWLKDEFRKYPAVYRSQESMMGVFPSGMAAMFVAMLTLAVLYAMLYKGGSPLAEGAQFGVLIGIFSVCSFVIHNYVNLNIGLKLTLEQAAAYLFEWIITGIVIALLYRPLTGR